MSKKPAPVTQAQIERALKAARRQGARELAISYEGVKLEFRLGENSGESSIVKVASRRIRLA
jgi:hypothetical protein